MTFPNHIAGGIVFTGIFSAISGVNIFTSPWLIGMTVFGSMIPDIDTPKSPIGRLVLPLSRWINRVHGHRTITHSFLFLFCWVLVIGIIEHFFTGNSHYNIVFIYAFLSHLILDMVTKSGVFCFYPWIRHRPAVIPGDQNLRMSTRNKKAEITVFTFFCLMAWFLAPLFQNGFWTSYNRTFGTIAHLGSEFRKSEDLLKVEYKFRVASNTYTGHGFCIEASDSKVTLIEDEGNFLQISKADMTILSLIPEHTGKLWSFKTDYFIGVSADSLNHLVDDKFIMELSTESNNEFIVYNNRVGEETQKYEGTYLTSLKFENQNAKIKRDTFIAKSSPRIETLRIQIAQLETSEQEARTKYENQKIELKELELKVSETSDIYEKEKLQIKIKELRNVKPPKTNRSKIIDLNSKISEIQKSDYLVNRDKKFEIESKFLEAQPEETRFTGIVKYIRFDGIRTME